MEILIGARRKEVLCDKYRFIRCSTTFSTGCIQVANGSDYQLKKIGFRKKEICNSAVYHHFFKWCHDNSLKNLWENSNLTIRDDLNISELNIDGSHTLAKKGGESVAYQGRKKGKTCNILPITGCQWLHHCFNRNYRWKS